MLPVLAFFLGTILADPPTPEHVAGAECPVHIVLNASSFQSSHDAGARLTANGLDEIYLPGWMPRTFRVEPAAGRSVGEPAQGPTTFDVDEVTISPLWSASYRFKRARTLGIRWEDVGVSQAKTGFKVAAGTYRLRFVFAVVLPGDQRGPQVHLCTVYSAPFALAAEDTWPGLE